MQMHELKSWDAQQLNAVHTFHNSSVGTQLASIGHTVLPTCTAPWSMPSMCMITLGTSGEVKIGFYICENYQIRLRQNYKVLC